MKKAAALLILMCILTLLFCSCAFSDSEEDLSSSVSDDLSEVSDTEVSDSTKGDYEVLNYDYIKAMWLSQYDMLNVYKDGSYQRSMESFTALAEQILGNIAQSGCNTVIVQVRPFADSFYPSALYPPSSFVSGSYSREFDYDPFKIIIKIAHENNLSVHAWINPMRGMTASEILDVKDKYVIKQWYNDTSKRGKYIVSVGSGTSARYYLNPCYDEVRALIADGAAEIVRNYDVDGVHMDDYFYPVTDTYFDSAAYSEYKNSGGNLSLAAFRRQKVSLMVKQIYDAVKSVDSDVVFGISPSGLLDKTYNSLYADVVTWCREKGYIDYIVPQIYFGLEHENYDFVSVYETWSGLEKHDDLKYCVGVSLGKAKSGVDNYAGTGKYEWSEHKDILKRCLEHVEKQNDCSGVFIFCYQYYFDPVSGTEIVETAKERENMAPVFARLGD